MFRPVSPKIEDKLSQRNPQKSQEKHSYRLYKPLTLSNPQEIERQHLENHKSNHKPKQNPSLEQKAIWEK